MFQRRKRKDKKEGKKGTGEKEEVGEKNLEKVFEAAELNPPST